MNAESQMMLPFDITDRGADFSKVESFDFEWGKDAWAHMMNIRGVSNWALGDLMVTLRDKCGESVMLQVIDTEQGEYNTWLSYERVARAWPTYQREPKVSWSHHKELASLATKDINKAGGLLIQCKRLGWSKQQLLDHLTVNRPPNDRQTTLSGAASSTDQSSAALDTNEDATPPTESFSGEEVIPRLDEIGDFIRDGLSNARGAVEMLERAEERVKELRAKA